MQRNVVPYSFQLCCSMIRKLSLDWDKSTKLMPAFILSFKPNMEFFVSFFSFNFKWWFNSSHCCACMRLKNGICFNLFSYVKSQILSILQKFEIKNNLCSEMMLYIIIHTLILILDCMDNDFVWLNKKSKAMDTEQYICTYFHNNLLLNEVWNVKTLFFFLLKIKTSRLQRN